MLKRHTDQTLYIVIESVSQASNMWLLSYMDSNWQREEIQRLCTMENRDPPQLPSLPVGKPTKA